MSQLLLLIDSLERFYGALPEPPTDPFRLFVWEVLSVHAMPLKRDAALAALARGRALTPDAMWRVPQKKLEDAVRLAGPYLEQRLRALRTGVDYFRRFPELPKTIRGPVPAALKALKGLPQMGDAGAYRMLLFAADQPVMPVDARVARVGLRLGFGERNKAFAKVARTVREQLGRELSAERPAFRRAFLYLSHHGAATCTETAPRCPICPIRGECPSVQ